MVKFPVLKKRPMTLDERKSHGLTNEEIAIHFYTEWVDVHLWGQSGRSLEK
ncbi:MAG: hypothetical protein ABI347_06380 [Nitrososphaera sp.]